MENTIDNATKFLAAVLMETDWAQAVGHDGSKLIVYAKKQPPKPLKEFYMNFPVEVVITGEIIPATQ